MDDFKIELEEDIDMEFEEDQGVGGADELGKETEELGETDELGETEELEDETFDIQDMARHSDPEEGYEEQEYSDHINKQIEEDLDGKVSERKQKVLYVVTEKQTPNLKDYMFGCGLKTKRIIYNITDARNTMLMENKNVRMVIVETGMGLFTATRVRQEIIDIVGLADKDNKITIFYVSEVLRSDVNKAIGKNNRHIEWIPYDNMINTIAKILSYREKYIDYDYIQNIVNRDKLYSFKGEKSTDNTKTYEDGFINIERNMVENTINKGDSLPKYKVALE